MAYVDGWARVGQQARAQTGCGRGRGCVRWRASQNRDVTPLGGLQGWTDGRADTTNPVPPQSGVCINRNKSNDTYNVDNLND